MLPPGCYLPFRALCMRFTVTCISCPDAVIVRSAFVPALFATVLRSAWVTAVLPVFWCSAVHVSRSLLLPFLFTTYIRLICSFWSFPGYPPGGYSVVHTVVDGRLEATIDLMHCSYCFILEVVLPAILFLISCLFLPVDTTNFLLPLGLEVTACSFWRLLPLFLPYLGVCLFTTISPLGLGDLPPGVLQMHSGLPPFLWATFLHGVLPPVIPLHTWYMEA